MTRLGSYTNRLIPGFQQEATLPFRSDAREELAMRVIVIGLGVIGRAVCLGLARRGVQVRGFDARTSVHREGSSHGESRIIRTAYFEHPDYVPLARESLRLWRGIEREKTERAPLLDPRPCLVLGKPESLVVNGVLTAAHAHGLRVNRYSQEELGAEFPWLRAGESWSGVLEFESGILHADRCRQALGDLAVRHGAELNFGAKIVGWGVRGDRVWAESPAGMVEAERIVLCPGPWASETKGLGGLPLKVMRQVSGWMETDSRVASGLPVFFFDTPDGYFYGMRSPEGNSVKLARHYGAPEKSNVLETMDEPNADDADCLARFVSSHIPGLIPSGREATIRKMEACRYTLTPDRHFLVGELPGYSGTCFTAAGMSGHGFKFAPAIGEMVASALVGKGVFPGIFSPTRWD